MTGAPGATDGGGRLDVIARSAATKQSILSLRGAMDCFAYARNDGLKMRHIPAVIARLDRAIQYSKASVIEPRGRGVLDTPHSGV
jgi:hypothetical protein